MLDIKIGTRVESIAIAGDLHRICTDICYAISGIYGALKTQSPAAAKAFREIITKALADEDTPIWTQCPNGIVIGGVRPKKKRR